MTVMFVLVFVLVFEVVTTFFLDVLCCQQYLHPLSARRLHWSPFFLQAAHCFDMVQDQHKVDGKSRAMADQLYLKKLIPP